MKLNFPNPRIVKQIERRHARMDRIVPSNPEMLSDVQKYHNFLKDPMIVTRVPPDMRAPFIRDMQRIVEKYGTSQPE